MKDQKAILIKCIKNDEPAFVIAGHDVFAVPALEAYYRAAQENGADADFLCDLNLVVQEMKDFQEQEPEKVRVPKLKDHEVEHRPKN